MANFSNISQIGTNTTMNISIQDFIKLEQIPINRKSEGRVSKMTKSFESNYEFNLSHLLSIVHIGVVMENFTDPVTFFQYKKGQSFIIDGNTRRHYWMKNPDKWVHHQDGLTAIVHQLQSFEQIYKIYNSLDSDKSAKIISEKIQGEFNRHSFFPQQDLLQRGMFAVALQWASRDPHEGKVALENQVPLCLTALKEFDNIQESVMEDNGKVTFYTITKPRISRLASAPIYAAIMTALRLLPNSGTLHDFIKKLITQDENEIRNAINSKRVTPYQIVAIEWLSWSNQRSRHHKDADLWLDGDAGKTSIQHMKKQLDFLLHWIQVYLENPNYTVQFSNGIKKTAWDKSDKTDDKDTSGSGWESFYKSVNKIKKAAIKNQNTVTFQQNFDYDYAKLEDLIINSAKRTIEVN